MADELAEHWLAAARKPEVASELEEIYAQTAAAVEARGPACWASGRCCNFREAGHLLYVTGLEAAYCVSRAEPGATGAASRVNSGVSLPVLTGVRVSAAQESGGCPFQRGNLCSVHTIKPLGCRVYFCDQSAQQWQEALSETMLGRVKRLHERRGIEYRYGEWRAMLARFVDP